MKKLKLIVTLCLLLNVYVFSSYASSWGDNPKPDWTFNADNDRENGFTSHSYENPYQEKVYYISPKAGQVIRVVRNIRMHGPDDVIEQTGGMSYTLGGYRYGSASTWDEYYSFTIPKNYAGGTLAVFMPAWDSHDDEGEHNFYGNRRVIIKVGYDTTHSHQWGGWVSTALNRTEVTSYAA